MRMLLSSRLIGLAFAAGAIVTWHGDSLASPAAKFDGSWTISITPKSGACRSRQVSVNIQAGKISYMGLSIAGGVDERGGMAISAHNALGAGEAAGRFAGDRGHGTWKANLPGRNCTGTWIAERA